MTDLDKARSHLETGSYTCVISRGEETFFATDRGVKPLLNWLEECVDMRGASAADRVVGRATAFLYCLLGVSRLGRNSLQIYCLSLPLLTVYMRHGYRKIVEIIGSNVFAQNRTVYDWIFTPALALAWSVVLYYLVVLLKKSKLHGLIFGR